MKAGFLEDILLLSVVVPNIIYPNGLPKVILPGFSRSFNSRNSRYPREFILFFLGPFLPSRTRRTGKNRAIRGSAFRLHSSASLRNALRAPLLSLVQFKPSVFFTKKYHDCFKLKYLILHSAIASKITIIEKNLKKFAKPAKKS